MSTTISASERRRMAILQAAATIMAGSFRSGEGGLWPPGFYENIPSSISLAEDLLVEIERQEMAANGTVLKEDSDAHER